MAELRKTSKKQKESVLSIPAPAQQADEKSSINLPQIIGSVVGLTGIATATLWLFGYSYANGLFSSANYLLIPSNFSPEDYINLGTFSFISLFINVIIVSLALIVASSSAKFLYAASSRFDKYKRIIDFLIATASSALRPLGIYWVFHSNIFFTQGMYGFFEFFPFFIIYLSGELLIVSSTQLNKAAITLTRMFYLSIILLIILQSHLFLSFRAGYEYGCTRAINKDTSVTLYTNLMSDTANNKIEGYYLLFFDKYYYYLYKEINLNNYKPIVLTVIDKTKITNIEIYESSKASDPKNKEVCKLKALETTKKIINNK